MHDKAPCQPAEGRVPALADGRLAGRASCAAVARESEEAFIGAMFQNLGRLLTEFYFPEEARQIRERARRPREGRPAACRHGRGRGCDQRARPRLRGPGPRRRQDLGPARRRCSAACAGPTGEPPARAGDKPRRAAALAGAGRQRDGRRAAAQRARASRRRIAAVAERYGRVLGVDAREHRARRRARRAASSAQMAKAMDLHVAAGIAGEPPARAPPRGGRPDGRRHGPPTR